MHRSSASRFSASIVSVLAGFLLVASSALGAGNDEKKTIRFTPTLHHPVKSAASGPLRDHIIRPQKGATTQEMLFRPPHVKSTTASRPTDAATIQRSIRRPLMPDPIANFEGVGDANGVEPADTTMAVGPNNVVQWVNLSFQVFDRNGNDESGGPVVGTSFWQALGGACATSNGGDIIVHYDYLADRWFFAQLAYPGFSEFHNCIAMTDTGDPLGPFHAWDYLYSPTSLNDYPKWGMWPDAYYGTFRDFANASIFDGMTVWAIDRAALIAGADSPTVIEVPPGNIDPNLDGLLPSDLSGGSLAPATPSGAPIPPNVLAGIGSPDYDGSPNAMVHLYQFHPNFADPPSSTLTGPVNLDVADFDFNVNVVGPGGSGMESLPFPLYRLDYRNFGDHTSIVFNHTVNVGGGQAGVRWYEIQNPLTSPTLAQQGTFAPDASHRWFGSAAIDVTGDIAVGFSVTDDVINPSIRYAGHLSSDPAGELSQGEAEIIAGSFPFFGGRWGDYSTIVVDPTDQCTFWYTTMYTPSDAGGDWGTRIGSFKFPSCTTGPRGTIEGTVDDGANPIAGATVTAGLASTTTDAAGHYSFLLPVGTYNMTASKYGFFPGSANDVPASDGGDTVQNFSLQAAPSTLVNGTVKDGSGAGWPLASNITITAPGAPTFHVTSDATTGYYEINLVEGITYNFKITTPIPGYQQGGGPLDLTATVKLPSSFVKNWLLFVDAVACNAPGYTSSSESVFAEDFNGGSLPPGWTVTDNGSPGPNPFPMAWIVATGGQPCDDYFPIDGNMTGGDGSFAVANSDCPGFPNTADTGLITPSLDLSSVGTAILQFNEEFLQFFSSDTAAVDVSTDGGSTWSNVLSQTSNARGPLQLTLSLGNAAGQANAQIRFHYTASFGYWWQVDNVQVLSATCAAGAGGLVVGNVTSLQTGVGLNGATVSNTGGGSTKTFAAQGQGDGFYALFAEAGSQTFEASLAKYGTVSHNALVVPNGTQRVDFALPSGKLTANPTQFDIRLAPNATLDQTLVLTNSGGVDAAFHLHEINVPHFPPPIPTGPFVDANTIKEAWARLPQGWQKQMRDKRLLNAGNFPRVHERAPGTPLAAGDVLATYTASFATPNGLPFGVMYDPSATNFYISNVGNPFPGDNKDYQFTGDGTETGATVDVSSLGMIPGDGAFNSQTSMGWQVMADLFGGSVTCVYEFSPSTLALTGNTICPAFSPIQTALAYNVTTDTYYSASFDDGIIWHFDNSGTILDSFSSGLAASGLAYNASTGHLFAADQFTNNIVVMDPANGYATVGEFPIGPPGITSAMGGLEIDCDGHLILVDQNAPNPILIVDSGETGGAECHFISTIPWVSENPTDGVVPALQGAGGNTSSIAVHFDATGLLPGLRQGQFKFSTDTPNPVPPMPLTLTVKFLDVPDNNQFQAYIYGAAGAGVMMGGPPSCPQGVLYFCPNGVVTRADMAGYLFRAIHGVATPPPVYQNIFTDVSFNDYNSFYIQGIYNDGITAGCGDGTRYCPNDPNTRAQMAVFIWKGLNGNVAPPACQGVFADVPCPSLFADYIEAIYNLQITGGCGTNPLIYCPNNNITNGQMATFLVKGFNIPFLP